MSELVPRIAYVVTLWSGSRRTMPTAYIEDRSLYLRAHLDALSKLRHHCGTVFLVVNKCEQRSGEFEKQLAGAAGCLPGIKVEVVLRPNVGMSYGALADVFERYGEDFDYFVFMEDDYVPVVDDFDLELLSFFRGGTGWVCGWYAGVSKYERAHASNSNGMFSTAALRAVRRKFGCVPHASGSAYVDNERNGQAGLSLLDCGYKIRDVLERYSTPHVVCHGKICVYGGKEKKFLIEPVGTDGGWNTDWMDSRTDFPLEYLDCFSLPKKKPRSLPVVSVVFETRPEMMSKVCQITNWHRRWFRFHREIIVSSVDCRIPGTTFVPCGAIPDHRNVIAWYSDFCIRWLNKFCDSSHVLLWQADGFVVNPEMWRDDFLEYDYVGAPIVSPNWEACRRWLGGRHGWSCPVGVGEPIVGNGGFSLRSKRFLMETERLQFMSGNVMVSSTREDEYLCVEKRAELDARGIRFCPVDLARKFSVGDDGPVDGVFGFHGRRRFLEVKRYMELKYVCKEFDVGLYRGYREA